MPLTFTQIEEHTTRRIWVFFVFVLLFYFVIASVMGIVLKFFIVLFAGYRDAGGYLLTGKQFFYLLLFSAIAAIIHIISSLQNLIHKIVKSVGGADIDPEDRYHRRFKQIVDEVNVATGSRYRIRPVIMPTVAMNAFSASDSRGNAVIGVTEGLLSKLSRQQLQGVVSYECAHIVSKDAYQATIGCALFGIYAAMMDGLKRPMSTPMSTSVSGGRWRSYGAARGLGQAIIVVAVLYIVLGIMKSFYKLIRMSLSRSRVLRADAVAAHLTRDPTSLSEALYAISRGWRGTGLISEDMEALFIVNPTHRRLDENPGFLGGLVSSHPPIRERIAQLARLAHSRTTEVQEVVHQQERRRERMREVDTQVEGLERMILNVDDPSGSFSKNHCPKCKMPLIQEDYEGTTVQRCQSCQGILSGVDKLPRIFSREEKGFDGRILRLAKLAEEEGIKRQLSGFRVKLEDMLSCPKCGERMARAFYSPAYFVEVDRCGLCGLIWFDQDELEMLQCMVEGKMGQELKKQGR